MAFRLKRNTSVGADPASDGYRPGLIRVLEAGTDLDDLSKYELRQLAPEHFVADDGSGLPPDWRDAAAQARDDQQLAELRAYVARTSPREES